MRIPVVALALAGGCVDDGGPRLQLLVPASAAPGNDVMIDGERMCGARGDCVNVAASVELDARPSAVDPQVLSWGATHADFVVPSLPVGSYPVIVTVDGRSSNALSLMVVQ